MSNTWTMQKCEECGGIGYLIDPPDGAYDCYECEGAGETMQPNEEGDNDD